MRKDFLMQHTIYCMKHTIYCMKHFNVRNLDFNTHKIYAKNEMWTELNSLKNMTVYVAVMQNQ